MTVEVRLGDWRSEARGLLTVGRVDHLIADPPFTPHVHAHCKTNAGGLGEAVDLRFEPFTDTDRDHLCGIAGKVVERWHIIHTDFESVGAWQAAMEANGVEYLRCGIWHKVGAMPQMSGDRPATAAEALVIGHSRRNGKRTRKRWNGGGSHAYYPYPIPHERGRHPCQKPLTLLERLIDDFTDHGDLVVDTHLGSGTTLVACVRRGRRGIGWEREQRWATRAARRCSTTHEQLTLSDRAKEFATKAARVEQLGLLHQAEEAQ